MKSTNTTKMKIPKQATQKHTIEFYAIQDDKHKSWIYCNITLKTVILIDPPRVSQDIISIIENINANSLFIILTSCEHKKKQFVKSWLRIYPFIIYLPISSFDPIITPYEHIYTDCKPYSIKHPTTKNHLAYILHSSFNDYHMLIIYIFPYLFSGSIFQNGTTSSKKKSMSEILLQYEGLDDNTIICPALGPISCVFNNYT